MSYNLSTSTPLIGLTGKKRSGKDTFASLTGFHRVALADPVRDAALAIDPMIYGDMANGLRLSDIINEFGWEAAKDRFPEVRRTLQRLGTEAIRSLDPMFWVRIAAERIEEARMSGMPVVVTDVRLPNEIDMIHALGGYTVRIVRPSFAPAQDDHETERALDGIVMDFEVRNNGSLHHLEEEAEHLVEILALRHEMAS